MAVWLRLPLVPVMVSVLVPAAVDELVPTLSVADPPPVVPPENVPVAPEGSPATLNQTVPLKPFGMAMLSFSLVMSPDFAHTCCSR